MTELPHFSMPFRFESTPAGDTHAAVNEQDTVEEIADCVELILRTEEGERETLTEFGRPVTLAFTTDRELVKAQVQQCIDDSEPRVSAMVEGDLDLSDPGVNRLLAIYNVEYGE